MPNYVPTVLHREITVNAVVTLHYFEHAKDYMFEGETHDFWELVYVDKGCLEAVAGDRSFELEQGQILFHKPNEFHNLYANGIIAPNVVIVTFISPSPAMAFFENKITYVTARQRDLLARIIEEGRRAFNGPLGDPYTLQMPRNPDAPFGSEQLITLYLETLLIDMIRHAEYENASAKPSSSIKTRSDNDLVNRIIQYMEDHLNDNLSFSAICRYSAQSATNLKTIFKAVTGQGVMEYYRNLKIDRAKTLLRESNGNITQIADHLGYTSVQYFSRHFKQATGMTPREYTLSIQAN